MKNIFVGNLNSNTSEGAVRQLFVAFGPVDQVKIVMDGDTDKSRGFGFVEMANAEDGEKAIAVRAKTQEYDGIPAAKVWARVRAGGAETWVRTKSRSEIRGSREAG